MNKQDIINSLYETINTIESMPSEEFTKKWMEVNDFYEKLNLDDDFLSDGEHSEAVIDVDVTPGVYKTTENSEANCSVTFSSSDEIDTLNIGLAA